MGWKNPPIELFLTSHKTGIVSRQTTIHKTQTCQVRPCNGPHFVSPQGLGVMALANEIAPSFVSLSTIFFRYSAVIGSATFLVSES